MAETSSRIRIGFIGLSKNGGWAAVAHYSYLQSPLGLRTYHITALLNSSAAASKEAIAHFGLDPATRIYTSAEDLAADDEIDLVVCAVKVPLHAELIKPAIVRKKKCFVEWPLAQNLAEATQLVDLAKVIPSASLVCGLEEPYDAAILTAKDIIASGRIGRVLHCQVDACGIPLAGNVLDRHEYALKRASGAGTIDIFLAHILKGVSEILGSLTDITAKATVACPDATIVASSDPSKVLKTVKSETADHIALAGTFSSVHDGYPGAIFSAQARTDLPWPGEPRMFWRFIGDRGQLRISAPNGPDFEFDEDTIIEHVSYATGTIEVIPWKRDQEFSPDEAILRKLPGPARSIGRLYEAFAKGETVGKVDWEAALDMHRLIDRIYSSLAQ